MQMARTQKSVHLFYVLFCENFATSRSELRRVLFFFQLTVEAVPRVRHNVEPLEVNQVVAAVTKAKLVGLLVQSAQRFFNAIQVAAFFACEEQHLLTLHRISAEIGHVIRVRIHVRVLCVGSLFGQLIELAERAQSTLTFAEQPLLQVLYLFLGQFFPSHSTII